MKKFLVYSLALLICSGLSAQSTNHGYSQQGLIGGKKMAIRIFSYDGTLFIFELDRLDQLDSFTNLTAQLPRILEKITPAVNALQNPQTTKLMFYTEPETVYVKEHLPEYKDYLLKADSLQYFKSRFDTLRISKTEYGKANDAGWRAHRSIHLSIILPHLSDLRKVNTSAVDSAVQKLKTEENRKSGLWSSTIVSYDPETRDWKISSLGSVKKTHIEPDFHVGLQYVRGEWVASTAVGIQLIKGDYYGNRSVFQLMWEPHFLFSTYPSGNVRTHRNDFITFRYHEHYKKKGTKEDVMRFSIGYLINRSGDLYRDHTIKFSVPGVNFKSLYLEPEFFFHEFFKHFSPSLKLSLNID